MATEDFTTYTEVDPNSHITKTASKITWAGLSAVEDAYVYKDYGANYFSGDFTHLITVKLTAATEDGRAYFWALTNAVDDMKGIDDAGGSYLAVFFIKEPVNYTIYIEECNSGSISQDSSIISLNTPYYLKIVRDESVGTYGTLYCYIYSDEARTTLLDTISQTLKTSKKDYRYLFATNTRNSGTAGRTVSGYCENLYRIINPTSPSVTVQATSAITANTATGNGNVTSLGIPEATQHGHVWATHPIGTGTAPSSQDNYVDSTATPPATGAYTSSLTGLVQGTKYYIRSYIINSLGFFYSPTELSFTTSADKPVVETDEATGIGATTATGNGSIEADGGSPITAYGVCWGLTADPDTTPAGDSPTDEKQAGVTVPIGNFFSLMTGLTANTLYHYRAYAINANGTAYGADKTFTTVIAGAPIVTTEKTTGIQSTTAFGQGTIVDIGGAAVSQHGHCWSTSANPTAVAVETWAATHAYTTGKYVNHTYAFNYKCTTAGTSSGTEPTWPTVNGGTVTDGTVVWTAETNYHTELDAGTATSFTSLITGLTPGTTYYTRAYATNSYGTSYGNNNEFAMFKTGAGKLSILGEHLVYTTKTGTYRALLGEIFT